MLKKTYYTGKEMKKIISILILMIAFISLIQNIVYGVTHISSATIIADHDIETGVEFFDGNNWVELEAKYVLYRDKGEKYPAYCITHGKDGVDERGDYDVDINDYLKDDRIWRTIINGYTTTQSAIDMDMNCLEDAYVATKQAIYCVILNRDVSLYRGVTGGGEKIVKEIARLKEIGLHGTQKQQDVNLRINEIGGLVEKGEYYYQRYMVKADVSIGDYSVDRITGFPEGSFVSDNNGNRKTSFTSGENFKIMIPKSKLSKDINGIISVSSKCKTYPVLYRQNKDCKYTRLCINLWSIWNI